MGPSSYDKRMPIRTYMYKEERKLENTFFLIKVIYCNG